MQDIKQVIVVRSDIKCRKGKMEAQCAHASMKVFFDRASKDKFEGEYRMQIPLTEEMYTWASGIFKKISLGCSSEEELDFLYNQALTKGIPCAIVIDKGLTEFHGVPTKTCIAIGPDLSDKIDEITGHLKLR